MTERILTKEESKILWQKIVAHIKTPTEAQLRELKEAANMTAAEWRKWERDNRKWLHFEVFKP